MTTHATGDALPRAARQHERRDERPADQLNQDCGCEDGHARPCYAWIMPDGRKAPMTRGARLCRRRCRCGCGRSGRRQSTPAPNERDPERGGVRNGDDEPEGEAGQCEAGKGCRARSSQVAAISGAEKRSLPARDDRDRRKPDEQGEARQEGCGIVRGGSLPARRLAAWRCRLRWRPDRWQQTRARRRWPPPRA